MIETGKLLQQRYRIDKQIGQGGMGAVYVATDERFGSIVAIKETLCMDDNYRKALEREARLLNSLKHIALPRVTDHFLEDNKQFLVMEYIAGEDLAHHLETSSRPFPVEQVLTWADQLLEALDFLHGQVNPVIHRDIKPQNLKVTPKGQIILLDFGLAKGNVTDAGHQTAAKSIFGYSRNYASLEQIQGTGTDPRSDLYSLAATLYHLLTNTPPEDALTRAMAIVSHQPDPLVPANRIVADIPAGVAGVLHSALALNAAQRPATADEMRGMLRDYENYTDVIASAPTAVGAPPTEIHSQRTKIMPGSTIHDGARQTDVKTEILPRQFSQVTSVKPAVANTASSGGRRFRLGAIAAAALLLCGSAIGGAYLVNPEMFDHPSDRPVEVAPVVEAVVPVDANVNANAMANAVAEVQTESPVTNSLVTAAPETEAPGRTATAKTPTAPTSTARAQTATNTAASSSNVRIDGDTVYVGNIKITNGRVETPTRTFGDNNGVPRPGSVQMPTIPPPNLQHLTPEQRRRVLRALRRNGINIQRPPQPEPTP